MATIKRHPKGYICDGLVYNSGYPHSDAVIELLDLIKLQDNKVLVAESENQRLRAQLGVYEECNLVGGVMFLRRLFGCESRRELFEAEKELKELRVTLKNARSQIDSLRRENEFLERNRLVVNEIRKLVGVA